MKVVKVLLLVSVIGFTGIVRTQGTNDDNYYTNVYDIKPGDIIYFEGEEAIHHDYGTLTYYHHNRKKNFDIPVKYYKIVDDVKMEYFCMEGADYPVISVKKIYEPDCEIPSVRLGPWTLRPEQRVVTFTKNVQRVVAYPAYKKKKVTIKADTSYYWIKGEKPIGVLKKYNKGQ